LDRELNINDFLSKYGVVVKKDLIMDKSCVQNEVPILENFRLRTVPVSNLYQPIIREFPSNFPAVANFKGMVFDSVNPVDFSEAQKDNNIKITTLFTSSGQARVEEGNSMGAQGNMIPLPGVEDINKEKFDKSKIPFGIAMEGAFLNAYPGTMGTGSNASSSSQDTSVSQTSAKPDESKESVSGVRSKPARMIIVGDADFVSAGGGDNFNFLLNSIEWLARDPYILSDLRGREFAINLISEEMSESVQTWIEILNIVVTPLLVVILSLLAWFFRRNRKRRHEFA
jgi:ABC-type uncharacterized transport system involved in gliding motility auxiliary subunit